MDPFFAGLVWGKKTFPFPKGWKLMLRDFPAETVLLAAFATRTGLRVPMGDRGEVGFVIVWHRCTLLIFLSIILR